MQAICSFLLFYILVGFLLQVLGDFKMNRYVRFFAGIIFLLLLMSPLYELFTRKEVAADIDIKSMWVQYEEARNYDLMLAEHQEEYNCQASEVLLKEFTAFLREEGYEIEEYEIFWTDTYDIEEMHLYLKAEESMRITGKKDCFNEEAVRLTDKLMETYTPEFAVVIYCEGEGE